MNSSNASEQCCSELQTEETSVLEGSERLQTATVYRPHADIVDSEINVVLHLNLPGVNEGCTDLTLEKNVLTIRGNVEAPQYDGFQLTHGEYGVGDFERSFMLSDEIDRERIQASIKQGVLTVNLPKLSTETKQKISVTAG